MGRLIVQDRPLYNGELQRDCDMIKKVYKCLERHGFKWDEGNQENAKRLGFERCYFRPGYYAEIDIRGKRWIMIHLYGGGFTTDGTPYPETVDIIDILDIKDLEEVLIKELGDLKN